MSNHNLPEHRPEAPPEDNEPSWRPQDPELYAELVRSARDDGDPDAGEPRDARRWESDEDHEVSDRGPGSGAADERPDRRGAGHRDPGAGRYGEQRLRELQRGPRRDDRPSPGSFEDRHRELGPDAGIGSWSDPTGRDAWRHASGDGYCGRDFEPERHELSGIHESSTGYRRGDERIGDPAGTYGHREHVHHGTGPHRGKGPAGHRADERIRDRVCESLTDDDEIDASDIAVSVTGGEVTLSGTVDDRRAKRGAEDCAYSVTGVRDVQNRLRVRDDRAPRSNPSSDAAVCSHDISAQDSKHRA